MGRSNKPRFVTRLLLLVYHKRLDAVQWRSLLAGLFVFREFSSWHSLLWPLSLYDGYLEHA
jgi:hypothetical protein